MQIQSSSNSMFSHIEMSLAIEEEKYAEELVRELLQFQQNIS